jgi:FAD/FMN-containing dehydrogenase
MMTVTDELVATLEGFSGSLLLPGDSGYQHARGVHNGLVDKRPALIARCNGVADVVAAVGFARENGLEVSIRGGGHGVAGTAVSDGGVMIDLSGMRGIHVDPTSRTARAQGGVTWGELDRATQLHGLAVTGGGVSTTGIAGLTLGGGVGWLMGKHGLATDNLVSAEIVTAEGRVLTARADEHDDLFWAIRGGGGNFGVVTSFQYRLHRIGPTVIGGLVAHPLAAARDVLGFFREFTASIPDDLVMLVGLVHAPDGSGEKLVAVGLCHIGSPEKAERDLGPLLSFGTPILAQVDPRPYVAQNTMLDAAYPRGALNYWKSGFLQGLSDELIATAVDRFATVPSPMTGLFVEQLCGAVTRVPVTATAFPHREPGYGLFITSVWLDPETTDANIAWTRETYAALEPYFASRHYANYLDEDDLGGHAARAAFGPNLERLSQVKASYDPSNFFHLNVNIEPATTRVRSRDSRASFRAGSR